MIIIATVRIAGFRIKKSSIDIVWELFWHQVEASVALITVSITAFRSLLGIKALKAREQKKRERFWFSHRAKLLTRYLNKETQDESELEQLPSIPGATLTGMRTFIHGDVIWNESRAMGMTDESEKDWPERPVTSLARLNLPTKSQLNQTFWIEGSVQGQQTLCEK